MVNEMSNITSLKPLYKNDKIIGVESIDNNEKIIFDASISEFVIINNDISQEDHQDYKKLGEYFSNESYNNIVFEDDYDSIFGKYDVGTIHLQNDIEICDLKKVPHTSYYSSYDSLTPKQRYAYLKYLENPFDSNADIGYVWLLYFMLSKQFKSNLEAIFDIMLNLKKSFSDNVSLSKEIFFTLGKYLYLNDSADRTYRLLDSYEDYYVEHLYISLICKFNVAIPPKSLFGLSKKHTSGYPRNHPELYKSALIEYCNIKYPNGLYIEDIFPKSTLINMTKERKRMVSDDPKTQARWDRLYNNVKKWDDDFIYIKTPESRACISNFFGNVTAYAKKMKKEKDF